MHLLAEISQSTVLCLYWISLVRIEWWQFAGVYVAAYICWRLVKTVRFTDPPPYVRVISCVCYLSVYATLIGKITGNSLVAGVLCLSLGLVSHRLTVRDWVYTLTCALCLLALLATMFFQPKDDALIDHTGDSWTPWLFLIASSLRLSMPPAHALAKVYCVGMLLFVIAMRMDTMFGRRDDYRYSAVVVLPTSVLAIRDVVSDLVEAILRTSSQKPRNRSLLWYMVGWATTVGYISSISDVFYGAVQLIHIALIIMVHSLPIDNAPTGIKTMQVPYKAVQS